ncbi:MAG: hypothetical protein COB30_002950 [Ectothiorhodospiraceae bacterium]|nr:hypothetical protein [Ectothiorhodospiraceae bacterium]
MTYYKVSISDNSERVGDIFQQRINLEGVLVHVQPRNEAKYKEMQYVWFVPYDTKKFDKRLTRKWPPFRVEFFVYAENDGYSFTPKHIKLSVNGKAEVQPSDISGPLDRSENMPDWTIFLDEKLGRIRCKANMFKNAISRGVSSEIKLSEKNWLCYELYYDIAVPASTDDIVITVRGMKRDGKELSIKTITYHEGEYGKSSL